MAATNLVAKVKCQNCGFVYDPHYLPIHWQACTPTYVPFTPPVPKQPRATQQSANPPQSSPPGYQTGTSTYQTPQNYQSMPGYPPNAPTYSGYQVPAMVYTSPQQYPQQGYPNTIPIVGPNNSAVSPPAFASGGQQRTCNYCHQSFACRALDHLRQCPSATQCRNCGNFCAQGTIQQHLASKCPGKRP